eukprot:365250-Chlamydomonas_euryale.AAC.2
MQLFCCNTVVQRESDFHEAQNGYRKGRGITDAMLTLRSLGFFLVNAVEHHQLPAAPHEVTPTLAIVSEDFTKPYGSIKWETVG